MTSEKSRPEQVFAVPAARQGTPELRGLVPAYSVSYYEQWIGPWAILPDALTQTLELFRKTDLHIHLQQSPSRLLACRTARRPAMWPSFT